MSTRRSLSRYAAAIAIFICANFIFATPNKDKENSELKFTARTELVLIPTLVTDKSHNHIGGLKKEDFTVLENGVEQKVATFEEITSAAQRWSRPGNPNASSNSNDFSNMLAGQPANRRVTLIVLDLLNTPFVDQAYARKDLLKYLTQSVDQREPTALYTLNRNGLHIIHDFTTDPRVLVAALHKVKGDAAPMADNGGTVEAITGSASPDGSAGPDSAR